MKHQRLTRPAVAGQFDRPADRPGGNVPHGDGGHGGHGGHGWMMIACCVPILVIAIVLVATGIVSPSFLLAAIACTAMMAMMMRGMNH